MGDMERDQVFGVRMNKREIAMLAELSELTGLDRSDVMRQALRAIYAARMPETPKAKAKKMPKTAKVRS